MNALITAQKKMDKASQESLPPMIIFAPSIDVGGMTVRRPVPPEVAFVYLSPTLEYEWQLDVDFIVAHELAHLVVGHGRQRQRTDEQVTADENAVDDLVVTWGYSRRKRTDSHFLRLLEKVRALDSVDSND
jgi:hypothetical protein